MGGRGGRESLDWVVRIYGKERGFAGGQGMVIASLLRKIFYDLDILASHQHVSFDSISRYLQRISKAISLENTA